MSQGFKITLVTIALILEFCFPLGPLNRYPHGMIGDVGYRRAERLGALRDYTLSRSPETKSALDREIVLMHKHEDWKNYSVDSLLVIANILIIYLFLKTGHTAQKVEAVKNPLTG